MIRPAKGSSPAPHLSDTRIKVIPRLFKRCQGLFCRLLIRSVVNGFQISRHCFSFEAVNPEDSQPISDGGFTASNFSRHIVQAVADEVDDAKLYLTLGIHRFNRFGETLESIYTENEHVF